METQKAEHFLLELYKEHITTWLMTQGGEFFVLSTDSVNACKLWRKFYLSGIREKCMLKAEGIVYEQKNRFTEQEKVMKIIIEMYFYDLIKVILDAMNIFSDVLIKNNLDNGEFKSVFLQTNRSINELEMKLITEK